MGVPATSGSCPHCGGTEVSHGIELSQTAEVGNIGLSYKAAGIFRGTDFVSSFFGGNTGWVVFCLGLRRAV